MWWWAMIRVENLEAFSPGVEQLLFPHSAEEFLKATVDQNRLLQKSEEAKAIYENDQLLCYAGVFRNSFVGTPFLWVLLGRKVNGMSARTFRKLLREVWDIFPGMQTVVEVSHRAGHRFAQVCGFTPLEAFIEIEDRKFQFYKVN